MTSIRNMRVLHRAYFATSPTTFTEPEFVATRAPGMIEEIPEGATRLLIDDVIELVVEAENPPCGRIYSPPVNLTSYEVVFGSEADFRAFMGNSSFVSKPALHPSLSGKVWLVEGRQDPPIGP